MSSTNSKSTIAKNIRRLRQAKGLSQDRLSKLADLSLNSIVNIESGNNPNPTIETLERIAKALGVSVEELLKK
jgi:transcriptional regulator with XRE-family HTH domain